MSRRALTLLLSSVLALVLTAAAVATPVPYVALKPGPTYNTLGDVGGTPVIAITGTRVFATDGHLDLTTVGVQPRLTLLEALRGWFDRTQAVVPRDVVYPPDKTTSEVNAENAESMTLSQNSAVTAAARQLGFDTALRVEVASVTPGSPADGKLQQGDALTTVDGKPVVDEAGLRAAIAAAGVGATLQVGYDRKGAPGTAALTTVAGPPNPQSPDAPPVALIGIDPEEVSSSDLPFEVDISLDEVGGPSAGLMFTLGILDKLGKESLTGGKYIAGTGEISANGTVGPIGGIVQKLIAARAKGAVVFLVPEANCAEALTRAPAGLELVEVATLSDALTGLQAVRAGTTPVLCAA